MPLIVFTVPEVKLMIFRAINSKDETAFLMFLPNIKFRLENFPRIPSAPEIPNSYNAHAARTV